MARMKSTAALLLLGLSAAACTAPGSSPPNYTLNSVNQPVVQRTDYVMDLTRSGGGLPEGERFRLSQWFQSLQLGYGDRVSVDTGRYDDPAARADVAAVAGEYGLIIEDAVPITAGSVHSDAVRVIVSRSVATVPGCPNWEDAGDLGARPSTSPNYGCAVNSNLAAMVADPNDLVLGQTGPVGGDAATARKAVDAYRRRVPTGSGGEIKSESSKGGN